MVGQPPSLYQIYTNNQSAMVESSGGFRGGMHPPHQPKHNVHVNTYLKKAISE